MATIFSLTIRAPAGSRLFGESEGAKRQRICHLLADAAQIIGSGKEPEPLRLEGVEAGEYEFGTDSLNRG
jgi:hypothetical protein